MTVASGIEDCVAGVGVEGIRVVTLLDAVVRRPSRAKSVGCLCDPVAAIRHRAGGRAPVSADLVVVVAGLGLADPVGVLHGAVAARREDAVGAGVGGVSGYEGSINALLVVLGVVVGLTTITEKEITAFLIAAIALVVGSVTVPAFAAFSNVTELEALGRILTVIFQGIATLIAPAAIIVAFKSVYALASRK